MCDCCTCNFARRNIAKCFQLYNEFKWILDSYVLDFYTNDHWSQLPNCWKRDFEKLSVSEIATILDFNAPLTRLNFVCPLSMIALRESFKNLNISRTPNSVKDLYNTPIKHFVYSDCKNNTDPAINSANDNVLLNHPRLKNSFWKRISPKKKHEIMLMAQICAKVGQHSKCNIVIDFGSGLGHLSRILAYGFGMQVCCLEAQATLSEQAKKLDQQFEVTASKHLPEDQMKKLRRPVHINMTIENTIDLTCLVEKVKSELKLTDDNLKFGLVGLHPCGDLAAVLLRFFKKNEHVQFINVASCCYMKLSTGEVPYSGYPLSKFLKTRENKLSYISRELACHAIETYIERLQTGECIELQIHAFRAALEKLIVKHWPEKKHIGLRNVKCTKDLTFSQYCKKATNELDLNILEEDILAPDIAKNLSEWKKVVIFYSLRLMFAPLVETIVLLDRLLYLAESDVECTLVPVFNPKLSPRSHILIATKHST